MTEKLKITDLHVALARSQSFAASISRSARGEVHALMGPNGSGKSTLGLAIMGHPELRSDRRLHRTRRRRPDEMEAARTGPAGVFLAFQRPVAIPGVKMADFLRHAATNVRHPDRKEGEELMPMREFRKELREQDGATAAWIPNSPAATSTTASPAAR